MAQAAREASTNLMDDSDMTGANQHVRRIYRDILAAYKLHLELWEQRKSLTRRKKR